MRSADVFKETGVHDSPKSSDGNFLLDLIGRSLRDNRGYFCQKQGLQPA